MDKNSNPPASVTILAVFVLFITSWNSIRIYSAIANWQVLREFGTNPVYILAAGLFWSAAGLWLFRAIYEGYRYAFRAGLASAGLYLTWYWLDRLIIQPTPAPNTQFSLIVSAIFLVVFSTLLSIPVTRAFFKKE